ncbi:unnamed protein product [Spirodela intermedia]|uniref:BED-type domain-containing protein n=1 Tax=Spirodela intermedia TaxID=51605 RepID=A0A7I8IHE8_SPIIN|nr:unnamed protein product [Spirodela intermedia]CAA6656796.1 unnamed protein product [Spirodela intermedia]
MASSPGPDIILPLSSQKHDPAWKHCHMIKRADRIHLRCMYCHKLFSGGGIHRIKEHLACQKGNASSCPKVSMEVRRAMQQSLDGVVMRRRKKQKLAEEVKKLNPVKPADTADGHSEAEMGLQLVAMPISVEPEAVQLEKREEEVVARTHERKRRRAAKNLSPPLKENGFARANLGEQWTEINGGPLDAVNSAHFQPMIDAIAAAGPSFKAPSYHDLRGWVLKNSVEEMKATVDFYKETWTRTGCSILADEWTTEADQTLINFMVYCPEGVMFLKSVDASQMVTSADALYELLKLVVEEVGVGNVLQVVTSNTETHALAGKRLTETFPSMFWTPCASRCVDAMLEDIVKLEPASIILEHARSITRFVYNHAEVLNMARRFTDGKELVRPGRSPSDTTFMTLKAMAGLKENLSSMVGSEEWKNSSCSKNEAAAAMTELICSPTFWSSVDSLVQLTDPLVQVLRMVDSIKRPAMGYIYRGLHRAKEVMRRVLKMKKDYMPYWNIIDWRWHKELPRPLQAAGFFLNPQFFYRIKGEVPNEIMTGVLDCIERLVPEMKSQDKINKELTAYKNATGISGGRWRSGPGTPCSPIFASPFGNSSGEWWSTYGGGCPNLARLAIRILSQTCSARGCERSRIPFEQMHSQRKNHLEHQRLSDLIYVRYNLRLQQRHLLKNRQTDPLSVDAISGVEDWTVERTGLFTREDDESNWVELIQPTSSSEAAHTDEDDALFSAEIDDEEYDGCNKEEEEEDDDDDVKQEMYGFVKEEE